MPGKGLEYALTIQSLMQRIAESQMENIERLLLNIVADAIAGNGILYTFGTGHSHVVAEDVAFRAGGLFPVDAILQVSSDRTRERPARASTWSGWRGWLQ